MHQKSPSGPPPRHCFVHPAFTLRNSPSALQSPLEATLAQQPSDPEERLDREPGTPSEHSNCSFNKGKSQGTSLVTRGGSRLVWTSVQCFRPHLSRWMHSCIPWDSKKIRLLTKTEVREDGELEDILDELHRISIRPHHACEVRFLRLVLSSRHLPPTDVRFQVF